MAENAGVTTNGAEEVRTNIGVLNDNGNELTTGGVPELVDQPQFQSNPNSGRKKKIYIIIGVTLTIAVIVAIVLGVTLSGNGDDTASSTSTTTTSTPASPTEPGPDPGPDPGPEPEPETPPEIDIEGFLNGTYSGSIPPVIWTAGGDIMFRNNDGDLVKFDIEDGTTQTILSKNTEAAELFERSSRFLQLSPDDSKLAFSFDVTPVYRHSFRGRYAVYDLENDNLHNIAPSILSKAESENVELQNFVWGPDGSSMAFVYENNVYYKSSLTAAAQQISTSGVEDVIYNGIPDWVYEEEVFSSNTAIWFSKEGDKLAYATFNDNDVKTMYVPYYGEPGNKSHQYTEHHAMRYPKAGTTNPIVTVTLHNLKNGESVTYNAPTNLEQPILYSVTFANDDKLALVWTNRVQNQMVVLTCTADSSTCTQVYDYNEPSGWIQNTPLIFNEDGNFLTIIPKDYGGARYMHVAEVTILGVDSFMSISRSNQPHMVRGIYKWTTDNVIWYRATGIEDSAEQHIYYSGGDGRVHCFSCDIKRSDGEKCLFNDAVFSEDGNLLVVNCAGPGIPQWFIYDSDGKYIRDWELNEELSYILGPTVPTKKIRMQVPVAEGFPDAEVMLQVPHDYKTRDNIPLLVYVYAGPNTAAATHRWSITWETTLVTRFGYAVALIDGRGSGLRDAENLFAVNRNLGVLDIEDQITVTRYLQNNLNWVDRSRTCIWGWSYGGYASSLALSRGGDVFKCAIAVAPVTDWRFYDSIYTERYMDLPSVNVNGYSQTSLLTEEAVEGFRNKNYLLIHGTADDNVHYQHAMELSFKLQVRNIQFEQMSYTDEDHGIDGVRRHLYGLMEKYLEKQLLQPHPPLVISREDFLSGTYSPKTARGTWVSDVELAYTNDENDYVLYNVDTDTTTILIEHTSEAGELLQLQSSRFIQLSPEKTHVAFAYDTTHVYRHTFIGRYAVYDIQSKVIYQISTSGSSDSNTLLQNFVWGPEGTAMAFVFNNDIYFKPSVTDAAQRLTTTGVEDVIYNGIPDWVYEEEVFSSSVAMWFSKDGNKLAYATFDDHEVNTMFVPHYGEPGNKSHQYTEHHNIRYPKVGTNNPIVTVTLRNLRDSKSITYSAPTSTLDQPILLSATFATNTEIALVWTNRVQNRMIIQLCSEDSNTCTQIFSYDEPNGWILNNRPVFNSDGSAFLIVLPQEVDGERYKHIVQVTRSEDTWTSRPRINTAQTVTRIVRWTDADSIWLTATAVGDSSAQNIYLIVRNLPPVCFSCFIKRTDGGDCLFNDLSLSLDGSNLLFNCAGPGIPQTFLYTWTGRLIKNWEVNEELTTKLLRYTLPKRIRLQVPVGDGYPDADVVVRVPHNYESLTNVPLLVYVYGGPDTSLVTNRWSIDWETSLITRYGIAVAHIDGRGSGLRNVDNLFAVNRRLGDVEIDDQIQVTRHLQDTFSWLDRKRACIWGWSYGGYASSLALARGDDVFKCAIAVAPVTDFRLYDTIYTERYMDLPEVNEKGYKKASMLNDDDVEGFRNKSYFLIHGTADDNVHYQHAMELSYLLQFNNVDFKQMSYTDEDHGLDGVRPHLYKAMEKYLQEQLQW